MKKDKTVVEATSACEEKYRLLFESNRDSITIFRLNSDGNPSNFIEANIVTTELFGYTKKDLLSLNITDIEIVSDKKRKKRIETLLSKGRIDFESIILNKKGKERNVEIETVLINYDDSPAVMNITRDITERKNIEKNTRKAQENLTTILEAIPDLLFEVGYDGRIYHYQAHRKDLLAVDPSVFMGNFLQDIMPANVSKVCFSAINEAHKKGWSTGKQYILDLPQGKHWFELSVSPIKEGKKDDSHYIVLARDITDRKLAEEKLSYEKERIKTILELVGNPIFLKDNDHKITYANRPFLDLFDLDQKSVINKTLAENVPENEREHFLKIDRNVLDSGISDHREEELTVNGIVHTIITSKTRFIDESGEKSLVGSIHDITERKQAEEKIKISEQNYQMLFNASTDSIFIYDFKNGKILDVNQTTIKTFGYNSKEEISKIPVSQLNSNIEPYTEKNALNYIKKTINEGDQTFEWISRRKDGSFFWMEMRLKKIILDDEIRVLAVGREITERKEVEQDLQENKENLQSIFDSVDEAIYVLDETGTFINVNKGAEKMYQYNKAELIGKTPQDIAAPGLNDFEEINRILKSVFKTGIPISFEFWAIRKNGEIFPKEVVVNKGKYSGKTVLIVTARDITKRKENEQTIRKNEEKLTIIFNLANSGIVLADIDGNFLEFNDWWLKKVGYSAEEFGKLKNFGLTHPDDLENSKQWLNKIISGEIDKYKIEKRFIRKDKTIFWGESSVSAIKDKNNKITSTIEIATDITERKKTEESLRESEEKYRNLVENSPYGIVTYINNKIAYVNDESLRIIKAKNREEIIGKPVLQFIHPDNKERALQRMKEIILAGSSSKIIEEKFVALNGETIYIELKAIPTLFEKQNAVQVIIHDITERVRTQDKIKQLSRAVEQSPVAIVITNTLGNIEYVNPKFLETTDYSLAEVLGKNPRILKTGHTTEQEYKHLWETLISGNVWFGEFKNKKKDGTLYWESASISPILNSQGKISHYIAIKEDITERKKIEQDLIKAKEKAEESDRLKLAFLANMSHEIRTPMNGILGFTELLKVPHLPIEEQQDFINIIEKSGKRMLSIINDIINISKVESGQIEVTMSETNVNEQIEYLQTFFKPEAKHKNILLSLTKKLSPEDTIIKSDLEKIYAILTNLIKNAIKFTNQGSIEFGCEKKGKHLEFFVKDTGLGISNSHKKIIFERFRQANETITRSHEGSGLGLAISKAYVEMLGGKIWVESEEGKGSTFYFNIPIDTEFKPKEKIPSKKADSKNKEENKIKDLKVLIVEDDAISKLLVTIAVKPYSKEIIKVSSGIEAIEACLNIPDIDLVMMDINMPEMGGYEATKQIREFNKDLVIIAQTANAMQSDHDEAIAAGCTDYISKPINIKALGELIQKYL